MLNWIGTANFLVAGSLIATNVEPYTKYAFIFFLIGHGSCLINAYNKNIASLKIRYIFFCIIDSYGIYNWFSGGVYVELLGRYILHYINSFIS